MVNSDGYGSVKFVLPFNDFVAHGVHRGSYPPSDPSLFGNHNWQPRNGTVPMVDACTSLRVHTSYVSVESAAMLDAGLLQQRADFAHDLTAIIMSAYLISGVVMDTVMGEPEPAFPMEMLALSELVVPKPAIWAEGLPVRLASPPLS